MPEQVFENERASIENALDLNLNRIISIYDRHENGDLTEEEAAELATLVRQKVRERGC
jgi:hypothetical protein